jgi:negative regulator of sigma E activity
VLHLQQNGDWRAEWFPETTIQRLWPSSGRALPVPDQEPERPWVKAARWQIIMKRVGIGAAVALLVAWIVVRLRGMRKIGTAALAN